MPVTDNIREKINALGLADVLRRLRAPPRRGLRGYAALLGALRGPPPPEDNEDAASEPYESEAQNLGRKDPDAYKEDWAESIVYKKTMKAEAIKEYEIIKLLREI